MQSSNLHANGQSPYHQKIDPSSKHRIDMVCLAILFVGFFSCLIRSDYNFAIIFFCYFVWQQRTDSLSLKLIIASTILLILFDIIFGLTQMRVWLTPDPNNGIWQTLRPAHIFGIFCAAIIMILKIILLILAFLGLNALKKNVQTF